MVWKETGVVLALIGLVMLGAVVMHGEEFKGEASLFRNFWEMQYVTKEGRYVPRSRMAYAHYEGRETIPARWLYLPCLASIMAGLGLISIPPKEAKPVAQAEGGHGVAP